ncbi:MAG: hypothetical protein AUJ55_07180 [Proteobacteria bacterium CG1_02_64_396]|nr:MAG: hypothetical protein AUJ55_07180 [Proteobacteria bacterium CG1_02_64_396]
MIHIPPTWPGLPLARYRFTAQATTPLHLPDYAGSMLRGAFGHALRKAVCIMPKGDCTGCLLKTSCVYPYIFDTPLPEGSDRMRLYKTVPHPYVIEPPDPGARSLRPGETFDFHLVLIGKANAHLPYVIHAVEQMLAGGLGKGDGRARLVEVADEEQVRYRPGEPLQPGQAPLRRGDGDAGALQLGVTLRTPLRLKKEDHLLTGEHLTFRDVFVPLMRRIAMLAYFHGPAPIEVDFPALARAAEGVEVVHAHLGWKEWTRYSARQKGTMQMGGMLGEVKFTAEDLTPFMPWLRLGIWCHAGKGTVFGLGGYRVSLL